MKLRLLAPKLLLSGEPGPLRPVKDPVEHSMLLKHRTVQKLVALDEGWASPEPGFLDPTRDQSQMVASWEFAMRLTWSQLALGILRPNEAPYLESRLLHPSVTE